MANKIGEIFQDAPATQAAADLREEMLQNLIEKYRDILAEGKTEEEAYSQAVDGIGDITGLFPELEGPPAPARTGDRRDADGRYVYRTNRAEPYSAKTPVRIAAGCMTALLTAAAVMLYILSVVPVIVLSEFGRGLEVYGVAAMFGMIAAATGILIVNKPLRSWAIGRNRPAQIRSGVLTAAAVMLYILAVVPVIVLSDLGLEIHGVVGMVGMVALATGILVVNGMMKPKYGWVEPTVAEDFCAWRDTVKRKRSGARIILTVGIICIVLSMGIATLAAVGYTMNWSVGSFFDESLSGPFTYENTSGITEEIKEIDIEWVSGRVRAVYTKDEDICVTETSQRILEPDERMRVEVQDGKLTIAYMPKKFRLFFRAPVKNLTVYLPERLKGQMEKLRVETVSADVDVSDIQAAVLRLETVSGAVTAHRIESDNCGIQSVSGDVAVSGSADALSAGTVSGDVALEGAFNAIDIESVSGDTDAALAVMAERIQCKTVSGDLLLYIPDTAEGFTIHYESVSGDIDCEFPTSSRNGRSVYENGRAAIDAESVSGDLTIKINRGIQKK